MRSLLEIAFGVLFLIGGIFNLLYTFNHGEEFFGSFAEKAMLPPARTLVRRIVIPNAKVITVLMVILQVAIAAGILGRGALVGPALLAGAAFALGAVLVSSAGGALANLAMGLVLAYLGFAG